MLLIVCPMYSEAAGLIEGLHLCVKSRWAGYDCFSDEENRIRLVLSSSGKMNAAAAAAALFASLKCDEFVVFGSCAGLKNQESGIVYMVHKITDIDTGFSYYPDMPDNSVFPEASLLTGSMVYGLEDHRRDVPVTYHLREYLSDPALKEYDLYDMESSAFCIVAGKHLGPHQIHILRVVSDTGKIPDQESFKAIMKKAAMQVIGYLKELAVETKQPAVNLEHEDLERMFKCSSAMKIQLNQLIRYAELAGIDWQKEIAQMKEEEILPCCDRENGKQALHELTRRITA